MQTRPSLYPLFIYSLIILILIFTACSGNDKRSEKINKAIDEGLTNSVKFIETKNSAIYQSLKQKLSDPITSEKAIWWEPRAMVIKELSDEVVAYINGLKAELAKESDETAAVNKIIYDNKKGKELFDKLQTYITKVFSVDSLLDKEFADNTIIISKDFDSDKSDYQKFNNFYFERQSKSSALNVLTIFCSNIRIAEGKLITYCYYKCNTSSNYETFTSAIVTQSTYYLKAGEEIEITAGIGEFSRAAKPKITIDGKPVIIEEGALGFYRKKVFGKPGKHNFRVLISYLNDDGRYATIAKDVEYTITN